MAAGGYEVSTYEEPVLQGFSKYTIYYPTRLETTDEKYPVIVVCNGSGTPISKYPSIPENCIHRSKRTARLRMMVHRFRVNGAAVPDGWCTAVAGKVHTAAA